MDILKDLDIMVKNFIKAYPPEYFKDKDVYASWLAQTYYFVCHSTPLLGYALPYLKNADLKRHFEHHISEEEKHELMALKDLEKLGFNIGEIKELSVTQAFYQSQYYRIAFEGATSLLGYILFLEALAVKVGSIIYNETKDVHKGSSLFLRVHAEEDPEHVSKAIRAILTLSPEEQVVIWKNMHYSNEMYCMILDSILKEKKSFKIAA